MDQPDLASFVEDLYNASTWWDTYSVLCSVPDDGLARFDEAVESDHRSASHPVDVLLAKATAANAGLRFAGFLLFSRNWDVDTDPITELFHEALLCVHDPRRWPVLGHLLHELSLLAEHLPSEAWPMALRLAASASQELLAPEVIAVAVKLAGHAPRDHPHRAEIDDLAGVIHSSLYRQTLDAGDLNDAIDYGNRALAATPERSSDRLRMLENQALRLRMRYDQLGDPLDLDTAIDHGASVIAATPDDSPHLPGALDHQANRLGLRYQRRGELRDLTTAIGYGDRALAAEADDSRNRPRILDNQAVRLQQRYRRTGDLSDLYTAIRLGSQALSSEPFGSEDRFRMLNNQAVRLQLRYEVGGDVADLNLAVEHSRQALADCPANSPIRPDILDHYATRLGMRYESSGELDDLDMAIELGGAAVTSSKESPGYAVRLGNQSARRHIRYMKTRDISDLQSAGDLINRALAGTPRSSPYWPGMRNNQAAILHERFDRLGNIGDLEAAIRYGFEVLEHTPRSSPQRPELLSNQAHRLSSRFKRSADLADLIAAIDYGTRALAESSSGSPGRPRLLSSLSTDLLSRFEATLDGDDVVTAAGFVSEWCELVGGGSGTFDEVFLNARTRSGQLAGLASRGFITWGLVARVGDVVLQRAAVASEGGSSDEVMWEIRTRLDGIVSIASYAAVRAGDLELAVDMLESGSATIARVQASRINWETATSRSPALAARALELQSQIIAAANSGDADKGNELTIAYVDAVTELRTMLNIANPRPATLTQLAKSNHTHLWIIATEHGGAAIKSHQGSITFLDLPDLTTTHVNHWHALLHPTTIRSDITETGNEATGDTDGRLSAGVARSDGVRGPTGAAAPAHTAVTAVLDQMEVALQPASPWLECVDWLIPTGICRLLPWQARHPNRRLHITATHTLTTHLPIHGPVIVFANPTNNTSPLDGAQHEGETLERAGHVVYYGPDATLQQLAAIDLPASVLHIAAHGTSEPAIWFHGPQPLHPGNIDEYRHIWPHIGHLVLNCCVSASQRYNLHDEALSIATIAHAHGTAKTTVALWPLSDHHAAQWATRFHNLTPGPNHIPTTAAYLTYG